MPKALKTNMRSSVNLLLLLLLLTLAASCHHEVRGPEAGVDSTEVDLGTVYVNETLVAEGAVTLTNHGDADLHIQRIETSCLCTTASPSADTLSAGATSVIRVRIKFEPYDTIPHDVYRTVDIYTNDSLHSPLSVGFKLKADIKH